MKAVRGEQARDRRGEGSAGPAGQRPAVGPEDDIGAERRPCLRRLGALDRGVGPDRERRLAGGGLRTWSIAPAPARGTRRGSAARASVQVVRQPLAPVGGGLGHQRPVDRGPEADRSSRRAHRAEGETAFSALQASSGATSKRSIRSR